MEKRDRSELNKLTFISGAVALLTAVGAFNGVVADARVPEKTRDCLFDAYAGFADFKATDRQAIEQCARERANADIKSTQQTNRYILFGSSLVFIGCGVAQFTSRRKQPKPS